MGADSRGWSNDRDSFVDPDGAKLEPEVIHWLATYAEATDDHRDATVAGILRQASRLLSRYRRESAAHREEYGSRLRVLTGSMPVMLWTTDTQLRVTTFAGAGLAAVNIDPSYTISLPLAVVLGMDRLSRGAADAHERALRGQPAVFEYDQRSRSYLAHVRPLTDPDGGIGGTIGLAVDVTERKRPEEALARREQLLAESQRLAQVGSWEWQRGDAAATWSSELYRIWGLGPQTFQPTTDAIRSRVHPEDRTAFDSNREVAIRTGQTSEATFRIVRPDGEVRHLLVLVTATLDADGQPARVHGVCQDITERTRADEARALWRERQARLDGMLFAVRELRRVARNLAAPEAGAVLGAGSTVRSSLDEALGAATALSRALDDIAELQRLLPPE